jgi:hypothetical protein
MPSINISDLRPAGSELFSDSESYMAELGDSEFEMINGGGTPTISVSVSIRWTINITARRTPQATDYLTPTPPAISKALSALSALSNPFNSF